MRAPDRSGNGPRVVILAGGLGTRLREETEFRPKPMVEVGGKPVIWHIMKNFDHFGLNSFVVCAGYKGEMIKEYFLNYRARNNDFTVTLGESERIAFHGLHDEATWTVTVADTGESTMTGGRVFRIRPYVDETFICTYGDGLSDVPIDRLLAFHRAHGKLATVTTVRTLSRFGVMEVDKDQVVQRFREKPQVDGWVNAGFFVFEPGVFDYLNQDSVLEEAPLAALAKDGQLMAFRHDGFWQPMDTYREEQMLNRLWDSGAAPWRLWS
ncbi:MAG: glucose-1-phosphate cytidylyltransferase [Chloroflexi bacterium]|nr:glucose-1-phosphate cytidylyltransferase [Chloroflexota bacterium]